MAEVCIGTFRPAARSAEGRRRSDDPSRSPARCVAVRVAAVELVNLRLATGRWSRTVRPAEDWVRHASRAGGASPANCSVSFPSYLLTMRRHLLAFVLCASSAAPLTAQNAAVNSPAVIKALDSLRNATRRFQV